MLIIYLESCGQGMHVMVALLMLWHSLLPLTFSLFILV